jgi:signal-transduction protein with cAMP-binding, CBS, and nucleotidyltransferase domain
MTGGRDLVPCFSRRGWTNDHHVTTSVHPTPSVREFVHTALVTVDRSTTLRGAAIAMKNAGVGSLVVMDADDVQGIVTERDVVSALANGTDPDTARVVDVESVCPRYLTLADSVSTAAGVMLAAGCRHLPVVDEGVAVGIVSMRDVVQVLTS